MATLLAFLRRLLDGADHPILVALDGPSGVGKSTITAAIAAALPATVVPTDDFFAAGISTTEWNARSAAERARDALDWRRLRELALEPLRAGRPAAWHPFDFLAGQRPDGSYAMSAQLTRGDPAALVLVEGAYSARPELADMYDRTILIDAPRAICHDRLAARESPAFLEKWHDRWDDAEEYYFREVRPPGAFDLIVESVSGLASARSVGSLSARWCGAQIPRRPRNSFAPQPQPLQPDRACPSLVP